MNTQALFWIVALWITADKVLPGILQVIVFLHQSGARAGVME